MSIEDILLQQVRQNVDRAKRTKETSMEYAPSPGQMSNFAGMLAPGAGYLDAVGEYPALPSYDQPVTEAFSNEPYPSFAENLQRGGFGGYFDASMQGLGAAGDTILAAPVVGPPIGGFLKTMGAFGSVMRAGSKAGKGAKTEEGIATLGKQPMFTPEDTLNLAYTPDGSYSPGIKDLIEKASPKLRGQGITQWANKNLKPKELEVLGIDEFIKANPKATLKETVEGISGNKVVVGKKVLGGGEGQVMDFETSYPLEDPLDGSKLYQYIIDDLRYELEEGGMQFGDGGLDSATQELQERATRLYNRIASESDVAKVESFADIPKSDNNTYEKTLDAIANNQYLEDPYEVIRPTGVNVGEDTFAIGNEEVGYQLFVDGKRVTDPDNIPYSVVETQIQLRNSIADEGYDMFRVDADDFDDAFDGFGGGTQYKQFIDESLPGGKNYREIIYTHDNATETHSIGHFSNEVEDGNYLAHALVRDRKLADGTETLHGDEIQSDLHSRGFKEGYKTPENIESFKRKLSVKADDIQDRLKDIIKIVESKGYTLDELGLESTPIAIKNSIKEGRYGDTDNISSDFITDISNHPKLIEGTNKLTLDELGKIENLRDATRNQLDTYYMSENLVPNYPYKDDYHEIVLKKMLLQAIEEGKPAISVSGSAPMVDRYSDNYEEFYKILYDQDIPKSMRKLAKNYGGEFEVGSLDIDNTFGSGTEKFLAAPETGLDRRRNLVKSNVIKITEEMRNKLLLEGIPDFAIGGIVNKGIATLKTAKQPTEGIVDLGLY